MFVCLHFIPYRIPECSIRSKSFALKKIKSKYEKNMGNQTHVWWEEFVSYPLERYRSDYLSSYGLNSTPITLLQGCMWHWITHEGWYAIKTKKANQLLINSSTSAPLLSSSLMNWGNLFRNSWACEKKVSYFRTVTAHGWEKSIKK